MNSYKLVQRLENVRATTYLSPTDQALYYELISVCNKQKWCDVFTVKTRQLCSALNITPNTLKKARENLAKANLIFYQTNFDKKEGCKYSFTQNFESTDLSCSKNDEVKEKSSSTSSSTVDKDTEFSPYIYNKTINKERRDNTRSDLIKNNVKDIPDKVNTVKTLNFPYRTPNFLSAWERLRECPKWRKRTQESLQLTLDKLGKYEVNFAIELMERAAECNWSGVVYHDTDTQYENWLETVKPTRRVLVW